MVFCYEIWNVYKLLTFFLLLFVKSNAAGKEIAAATLEHSKALTPRRNIRLREMEKIIQQVSFDSDGKHFSGSVFY